MSLDSEIIKKPKKPRLFFPKCQITQEQQAIFFDKVRSSGLSASEYQRQQNLNGAVIVRGNVLDVEAVKQLKYIGNNLNQLTRSAHIHGDTEPQELKQLLAALNHIISGLIWL